MTRTFERLTNIQNILFTGLIVLHLVPIWAFDYFPSQDGPAHLENADIIREYSHSDRTLLRRYYSLNQEFTPNWFGHLTLAALMSIMSVHMAEKVFLSVYVILLPVSIRYIVCAVQPESTFLAVLAFPFIYNYPLHMGFYSFCYSLPVFCFFLGYWLKHRTLFTSHNVTVLAALALLLYCGHIVSMALAFVGLGLMCMWTVFIEQQHTDRPRGVWDRKTLSHLKPLYAVVPAIFIFAIFFFQSKRYDLPSSWEGTPSIRLLFNQFVSIDPLVSFERHEVWLARAISCLFAALIIYVLYSRGGHLRPTFSDGFLGLSAIYAAIYFVAPSEIGGAGFIRERINLFTFLSLIVWFAAQSYVPSVRRATQVVAICLAALFLGVHSFKYFELNSYLREYVSARHLVGENATLLPIYFSQAATDAGRRPLSLRVNPFLNAAGYVAVDKGIIDLRNYEAAQTRYFPVLFRPDLNPGPLLRYMPLDSRAGELLSIPTAILEYPQRTGEQIDYVLLWGVRPQDRKKETAKRLFTQLREGYDLVYTSPQRGLVQLYRRKTLQLPSQTDGAPVHHGGSAS